MDYFSRVEPGFLVGSLECIFGAVLFPTLFHIYRTLAVRILSSKDVSTGVIMDICNKLVSSTFALTTCWVGWTVLKASGKEEVMKEEHPLVRHYMCYGLSYFLYDLYSMYVVYVASQPKIAKNGLNGSAGDQPHSVCGTVGHHTKSCGTVDSVRSFCRARPIMVLHHLVLPLIGFPVFMFFRRSLGDTMIACGFLMEASTPFVSLRAILSNLRLKDTFLYMANGVAMIVMFFCCRILNIYYIYSLLARERNASVWETVVNVVPWFCNVSMLVLLLPQLYWFYLMVKGCVRILGGGAETKID